MDTLTTIFYQSLSTRSTAGPEQVAQAELTPSVAPGRLLKEDMGCMGWDNFLTAFLQHLENVTWCLGSGACPEVLSPDLTMYYLKAYILVS